jgi:hypothetical protein
LLNHAPDDIMEKPMKTLRIMIAAASGLLATGSAFAHGDHPAAHGGIMGRGDDAIVVEFVMERDTLTLYVHDEDGKPLPAENVTGTLTLSRPQRPAVEVKLVRTDKDKFTAPDLKPITGDRLRAHIKLPAGQEVQALGLYAK